MNKELDPHHLVALMSFTFANQQDGSSGLDPPPQQVKSAIFGDHHTGVRTFPILDAIAGISVSEVESQIVAVALQFDSRAQEIHLTVATNKTDGNKLVSHLTAVWGKLQALSNTYAEQRGEEPNLSGRKSPEIPGDVALPLRIEIFRDVYQFCMRKQMKRIRKWLGRLNSFVRQLVELRGDADLEDSEENLYLIVVGMLTVLKLLMKLHNNTGTQLADREWEEIYMQSMSVTENATLALEDGNYCEILAKEIKDDRSEGPFQLRRALKKLTFLACHIDSLISFAHSPRLRFALKCAISISTAPEGTRWVKFPRSREQWQSILEAACTGPRHWQWEKAEELLKKYDSEGYMCPPHPECGLIHYLEARQDSPWDDVPPFTYIGVSRPSCGACRNWITAFNGLGGRQFYIGSMSGKWYWPWGLPWGKQSLGQIVARNTSREYSVYQDRKFQARARARFCLSVDQRERIRSKFAAINRTYGSTPLEAIEGRIANFKLRMQSGERPSG